MRPTCKKARRKGPGTQKPNTHAHGAEVRRHKGRTYEGTTQRLHSGSRDDRGTDACQLSTVDTLINRKHISRAPQMKFRRYPQKSRGEGYGVACRCSQKGRRTALDEQIVRAIKQRVRIL